MKLKQFIQQETVLTAAAVLAVVSAFFVPPDVQYLGYIDLRTLAILFSLMTVMAGLRRQGFFDGLGRALLSRTHSTFQLTLVLVGLCFFGSMFITNDVSLLTFVPFTFVVLSRLGADVRRALLIPVVCMQTIAANLGSMLTPIGNPQNLYLYGKSGMSTGEFVLLMLPYTLVSLLLLLAWAALVCRKTSTALSVDELVSSASQGDQKIILLYLVLFAVCLLSVIRVLPYGFAFAAVLVCVLFADPHTLRANGKQHQIQQDDLLIPLRRRRRNKLIHGEGGRGFPADHCCPSQQQEQRDQCVGQHKKHKSPDAHAAFSVKIEVLRVADGGQHTAKVCRNGLHTDHRDQKGAADIRSQTAQDHERKGNEGQQGNIVGDEHTSEKAQPDQYQRQLKGAVGTGQQCPAQSIKKALPPQPGHDRHQGKQNRQRAQVDIAEILRIRRNKEGGDDGQHSGCGEDRFLLNELFEFHRDTSL